jgi:hypothetical protein
MMWGCTRTLQESSLIMQVFRAICSPMIYQVCQVSDPSRFFEATVSNKDLISQVTSLRIYDSLDLADPSFAEVLSCRAKWSQLGTRRSLADDKTVAQHRRQLQVVKHSKLPHFANIIRSSTRGGPGLLPNLKTVAMTGIGDSSWGRLADDYARDVRLGSNRLAYSLMSLPSVEHYCQTGSMGPLALDGRVYQP